MSTTRNEVVVVTGATAGVGRAIVREFARHGASIGLIARGRDRLEATRREAEQLGAKALPLSVDVANSDQVQRAARQVESEFGPIDVWVNDAMTTIFAPITEIQPEEFKRATEVTYLGCVYGTMAALKQMLPRDKGARAIYYAAHQKRREIFVGGPTVKAIYGQDLAPGFADWYLGTHGYDSQQTDQSVPPNRPDNLFDPVPGDYSAHGIFSRQAKCRSIQNWMNLHRAPLAIAAAALLGAGAFLWNRDI